MIISTKPISNRGTTTTVSPPKRTQRVSPAPLPKQRVPRPVKPVKAKPVPKPPKQLTIKEVALNLLEGKEDAASSGKAVILFNHYKKEFNVFNTVVKWEEVDAEYAFSFVYRGKYRREMYLAGERVEENLIINKDIDGQHDPPYLRRSDDGCYFIDVKPFGIYKLFIEEDPKAGIGAEGLRISEAPLRASDMASTKTKCDAIQSGNAAVRDITQQLLQMDTKDLQGEEARRLREARDVEDVLFNST